ncbi:MAG: prepilin-type N-terminal cleavage/methylation domain-containing protein [Firmicutes bacterium]|nr:prepilin-type N-terminal cleavage/methylation domain-containing protein [Bacillota bacterium]
MILKIADYLRNLHREEEGFTLIELLIVIAIIAVIAAIAIPMVASRIDDARESADRANVRTLQGLVDQYYIDKDVYPTQGTANGPDEGWIKELIEADEKYLHAEGVSSPYPDGEGYKLDVVPGVKEGSEVGTVTSTEADRWKEAETGG